MTKDENWSALKVLIGWLGLAVILAVVSTQFEFFKTFDANFRDQVGGIFKSIPAISSYSEYPHTVRVVSYYFICTSIVAAIFLFPSVTRSAATYRNDKIIVTAMLSIFVFMGYIIFNGVDLSLSPHKSINNLFHYLFTAGWFGAAAGLAFLYLCLIFSAINLISFVRRGK